MSGTRQETRRRRLILTSGLLASVVALWLILSAAPVAAQDEPPEETLNDLYLRSHQVGGRIGGWANLGDSPPEVQGTPPAAGSFTTDFSGGNFYLEGYFAYRFNRWLVGEFSLGLVSRGDVTIYEIGGGSSFGSLNVYPVLMKLRVYPFAGLSGSIHPYVFAAGGVYYGKHSISIVNSYEGLLRANFGEESQTALGYALGGGIDWPLASVVALDLNIQYLPIDFGDPLIAVEDYSSVTITVGVKYLFFSKNEDKR